MNLNAADTEQSLRAGATESRARQNVTARFTTLVSTPARLVAVLGSVLFVIGATPVFLVASPPLQDLPNHLASATVILNPSAYPEYVFNGFNKTNSALFAWLAYVAPLVGSMQLAGKLFTLLTLAVSAWGIPAFVYAFGGRRRAIISTFFAWPMVHNWFVAMGMLDFAMGVAISLVLLVVMKLQNERATVGRGVAVCALSFALWFTHVFPLLLVGLLFAVEIVVSQVRRERKLREWFALALPLIPAGLLSLASLLTHLTEPRGAMTAFTGALRHPSSWELFYNLWAEWMWTFTKLSAGSALACIGLVLCGILSRNRPTFFSWPAVALLAALYAMMPSELANWYSVNSRFIPFLWFGLLLRVPERLPFRFGAVLTAAATSYGIANCIDYVRLDREVAEFTRAMDRVPMHARMLPLIFRSKTTSENTQSLLHVWGHYVANRKTAAPLLFAHSRSFPVMYKEPPLLQLHHKSLESFSRNMGSPEAQCAQLASIGIRAHDCNGLFIERWHEFFSDVAPEFSHLLLWDAPIVPPGIENDYRLVFREGRLAMYERVPSRAVVSK